MAAEEKPCWTREKIRSRREELKGAGMGRLRDKTRLKAVKHTQPQYKRTQRAAKLPVAISGKTACRYFRQMLLSRHSLARATMRPSELRISLQVCFHEPQVFVYST